MNKQNIKTLSVLVMRDLFLWSTAWGCVCVCVCVSSFLGDADRRAQRTSLIRKTKQVFPTRQQSDCKAEVSLCSP